MKLAGFCAARGTSRALIDSGQLLANSFFSSHGDGKKKEVFDHRLTIFEPDQPVKIVWKMAKEVCDQGIAEGCRHIGDTLKIQRHGLPAGKDGFNSAFHHFSTSRNPNLIPTTWSIFSFINDL